MSARHRWRLRSRAYDNFRTDAVVEAIRFGLRNDEIDWQERARRFRENEWRLHEAMRRAAHGALDRLERTFSRPTLQSIVRLLDFSSRVGRRAAGLPEGNGAPAPTEPLLDQELAAALDKIYGDPKPEFKQELDPR